MVRYARPGWRLGWMLWVGLFLMAGTSAIAQSRPRVPPPPKPRVELKEHTPNPFVTATSIPFVIRPEVCSKGHRPQVTLKIYNVLVQVVAVPVLERDTTVRLDGIRLRCGEHRASWDGRVLDGERDATPGVYYYQLTVDGERYTRKMIVQRRVTSRR